MAESKKCPHCEGSISKLKLNQLPAEYQVTGMVRADIRACWVYSCPLCGKAIAVHHASDQLAALITSQIRASR